MTLHFSPDEVEEYLLKLKYSIHNIKLPEAPFNTNPESISVALRPGVTLESLGIKKKYEKGLIPFIDEALIKTHSAEEVFNTELKYKLLNL